MWDVVVVFESVSVCCCGPGVVSAISVVQVLVSGRVLAMNYSGCPGHSTWAHTFYHPSVITVVSCMCTGDSLRPPLLLLCR